MARWATRSMRALPWPLGEESRRRAIRERLGKLPAGGYTEPTDRSPASRVPPQRDDEPADPVMPEGTTPTEV
jgi:hypothetical protein